MMPDLSPLKPFMTTKDFLVTGETFNLVMDANSEMLITEPWPSIENLPKYYESTDYISHNDSTKGLISFFYQVIKKRSLRRKLALIAKLNHGVGSILDIGAGTGDFLLAASKLGWTANGVEPNENARNTAKKKNILLQKEMDSLTGEKFDVITLWHVLEHLPDLENTIKKIELLLNPGGLLVVAVPNYKSYDAKYYKGFWAGYDVPRHLWHFSRTAMASLFSKEIQLFKIKPLVFDSFYVSLLSEKYKSNNRFSLYAIWIGLWSNLIALKTKEYSSLIYIFTKKNKQ